MFGIGATPYLENQFIDFVLRNQAFTPPAAVYFGLFSGIDAFSELTATQGGYARQAITFGAPVNGVCSSTSTSTITASSNWGVVQAVGIFDASTAGNELFHGTITPTRVDNTNVVGFDSTHTIDVTGFTEFMSSYLANAFLNHVLRNTAYTPAATVYAALYTGEDNALELSATQGGYSRKAVTFAAASGGATSNSGNVTWTASNDWKARVGSAAICDASTAGNILIQGPLEELITPKNGQVVRFATSARHQLKVWVE